MDFFDAIDGALLERVFAPMVRRAGGRATPLALAGFAAEAAAVFWVAHLASLYLASPGGPGALSLNLALAAAFVFSMSNRRKLLAGQETARRDRRGAASGTLRNAGSGMLPRLGTAFAAPVMAVAAFGIGGSFSVALQACVLAAMCASFYFEALASLQASGART